MRVKIDKYAEGGFFHRATFLPASFTPGPAGPIANSTGTSTVKEEKKLGEEDIYKTLLDKNGLTSDVYRLMADLGQQDIGSLTSTGGTSRVLSLIGKVNEIVNNRKMWEEAASRSIQNGSYEEVAISNGGQLFYKDKEGSIKTISPDDYKKAPSKYGSLMSVADLLNERQNNINYAYDKNIINIAQNSVGLDEIKEDILKLFDTLSSYTDLKERTYSQEDIKGRLQAEQELIVKAGRKPNAQEQQGLAFLTELATTPGEFVKYEEKESGKGRDIAAAYNYILGTLNDKEKRKLEVTAKLSGTTGTEVIKGMLYNVTARSYESNITPMKASEVSDKPEAETIRSLTSYQMFHKDKLRSPDMSFTFNDPKMQVLFRGAMGAVGPLITPEGEAVGMTTLGTALNTGLNQILKTSEIYFGEKKVSTENLNNIIYDGADVAKVYIPVGRDGSPDYEAFADFKEAYSVYEMNKDNWSSAEASRYFQSKGYSIEIDEKFEDGKRIKFIRENESIKPFFLLYGYTNDATDLLDNNKTFTTKLSKDEQRVIVPRLEQTWTIGTGKSAVNITPSKFWNIEEYYKGMIAIPYRKEYAATVDAQVGQGPRERISTIADVQRNLKGSTQPVVRTTSAMPLKNN